MRTCVIATGGTIDRVYFDAASTGEFGELQVGPVFRESNVTFDFLVESVVQKYCLAMTGAGRALNRKRVAAAPRKAHSHHPRRGHDDGHRRQARRPGD